MSKAQSDVKGTATAPLLYWLAVICGLTGITVLRIDEPSKVVPIWFGAIVGISLGQLIAVLRIRVWTTALTVLMSSWIIGPGLYVGLCELFGFGTDTETALMALLPAFVCGYASLTERGGLLAFWYPAMLWMLVILDGEAPGSFAPRAYLPMALGLGVFFVAFLRTRETRRAALWKAYAHTRLATPGENSTVSSPVRGMSQLAFTALVGSGAFLLAAWVAPNLFQKDRALHQKMAQVPPPQRYDHDSNMPCCPESWETEKVREYLPLRNEHDVASRRSRLACTYCPAPIPTDEWGGYGTYHGAGVRYMGPGYYYGYDYGRYGNATSELTYAYNGDGTTTHSWNTVPGNGGYNYGGGGYNLNSGTNHNYGTNYDYNPAPVYMPPADPTPVYTPPANPTPVYTHPPVDPTPVTPKKPIKPAKVKVATPSTPPAPVVKPAVVTPKQMETPKAKEPPPAQVPAVTPPTVTSGPEPSAPWGVLLPLMAGIFLVPLGSRFVRRQVTLAHLARPFWKETVDQRISNHWQRVLIGLRDAGIQLRATEQPGAFAKRVGLKGMESCATILERVRHGVRVEDEDLATMDKASSEIYGEARKKAGVAGRIAGSFRWPLV